ncbi:MAG: glycosyltransferase family 9 protein [Betaproteobacteria bacterium]|nr:glycosyltransferase family 9 protein [Betaproteobacteria bacterium]
MKVLVVKRDKLGDLLLATPMLAHLRASRPQAQIHLLANDYNAWVVDGNADIDRRRVYRRVRHAGRISLSAAWDTLLTNLALRRERYDWVIVANGEESPRAIERGLAVRGARCVAYCDQPARYPRLSDPLPVQPQAHEMDRMLGMLRPLGIAPPQAPLHPKYVLPADAAAFATRWLAERGLQAGRYVVLGLGARRAKKQPSTQQILRWSAHFRAAWGLDTVFMWTPGKSDNPLYPGDDEVAQPVLDAQSPIIHPFRGPIREALGLIWSARVSLFPDSGLMHFAAASPGGVLGFFAETEVSPSPVHWAPRGVHADWLEAGKSVSELEDAQIYARLERLLA